MFSFQVSALHFLFLFFPLVFFAIIKRWKRYTAATRWIPGSSVVVTGASSGIGAELALLYARRGAKLLLTGRNEARLAEVAKQCSQNAHPATVIHQFVADLTVSAQRQDLAEKARYVFDGTLDILILNQGISMDTPFSEIQDLDIVRQIMETNYFACIGCAKDFEPLLKKRGARIAVISSLSGLLPVYRRTAYSASKHAVHGFFDSLRIEWAPWNVKVTICCPGFIDTPIRANAVKEGRAAREEKVEKHMMSAMECARRIVRGIDRNEQHSFMTRRDEFFGRCFMVPIIGSLIQRGIRWKFRKFITRDIPART